MNENEEIQKGLEAFLDQSLTKDASLDLSMTPHKKVQVTKQSDHGLQEPIYGQQYQQSGQDLQAPIYGKQYQQSGSGQQLGPARQSGSGQQQYQQTSHQAAYAQPLKKHRSTSYDYEDDYDYDDDDEEDEDFYARQEKKRRKKENAKKRKLKKQKAQKQKKKKQKKQGKEKKKKSIFKRLLMLIVFLAILYFGGMYLLVSHCYNKMKYEEAESFTDESMKDEGVINILLIGNDSREDGEDGRSDAMILVSISKKTKSITMTSLLRDMYVEIPGHDGNRLNAAYAYGGPELLMETIEYNFDIHVSRYVLVNFQAFANLVDAVGGIDLEVTNDEVQLINGYLIEYNQLEGREDTYDWLDQDASGMLHLDGAQALAYTRNRYIGTDFGRTERQRKVLTEVFKKLPGAMVTNSGEVIDGLFPNLTTNLTKMECYSIGLSAYKILSYDLNQQCVPIEGSYKDATIRSMAVLEVDFDANKKFLRETIYGDE